VSTKLVLLVGLGGGLGSVFRFTLCLLFSNSLPWVTLSINITGGLLIGMLATWIESIEYPDYWRAFWMVGFCGGFTTFSAFGYDFFNFFRNEQFGFSIIYIFLSIAGTLSAVFLGHRLVS
jgi:CrcB protein